MEHLKKGETPKVKKKRRWPIVLLIILIVITLILGGSALAIYLSIGDMTPEQTRRSRLRSLSSATTRCLTATRYATTTSYTDTTTR